MKQIDKLWAPWRVTYVTKIIDKAKGCTFCRIDKQKKDKKNLVYIRTKHCYTVLNLFPYNNGHSLVLPYRHVRDLSQLKKEERDDLINLMMYTQSLLEEVMHPTGFNIGINLGRDAGAGFPGHVHIHIVPRWKGDVNFMPVVGHTKVISQSLEELYRLLSSAHKKKKRK